MRPWIWAVAGWAVGCVDVSDRIPTTVPDAGPDLGVGRDFGPIPDPDPQAPPNLRTLTPSEGSVEGGTRVLLRGEGFQPPAEVFFGNMASAQVEVLDAFGVEAVTPSGSLGPVDVRIVTPTGTSSLAAAFTYVPLFRIDQVIPARIPEEGGPVEVVGRGFTEDTLMLFDRRPLVGAVRQSERRILGVVPPLPAGRPRVEAVSRIARAERRDLVTVFPTPDVDRLEPAAGSSSGGQRVEVVGSSLQDVQEVRLGGVVAPFVTGSDPEAVQAGRLLAVQAPALAVGARDLVLQTADGSQRYPGAYQVLDVAAVPTLQAVVPARAQPGQEVALVGTQLDLASAVSVDGVPATLLEATSGQVRIEVPSLPAGGPVDLALEVGAEVLELPEAFQVLPVLSLTSISPQAGPGSGETEVVLRGTGFSEEVVFTVGGVPLVDVSLVDDTEVRGRIQGGPHGPADVVAMRIGETDRFLRPARAVLEDAFRFEQDLEILRVFPPDGSISGNTFVTVYGRGLQGPADVRFGGISGSDVQLENGSVLSVRSPAFTPGTVPVDILDGPNPSVSAGNYTFFDPRVIQGGGFGGPIRGDVNVSVVDGSQVPVEGALVQVGLVPDPRYVAVTDANGMATISEPDLEGPLVVTAGARDSAFVTMVDYDTRNLTVRSPPFPQPPPEDAPINPCPGPVEFPVVRGNVFGLKSELDPNTDPNRRPVVTVTYSDPSPFQQNPFEPPGQFTTVLDEGEEFQIVAARAGSVAVYALLEDVNINNPNDRRPVRLGVARSVPVAFGQVTEDVQIDVNIELDQSFDVRLDTPPDQPDPSTNAVFPFLNVESDGVIPFPVQLGSGDVVTLENMPSLAQSEFIYLAGSFRLAGNGLTAPFSLSIESSVSSAEGDEADLGPYLATPRNLSPKPGQLLDGEIRWEVGSGVTPDLIQARLSDVTGVSSRCCTDLNANGICDPSEPEEESGGPVPFLRWSLYAPGGRTQLPVPNLPSGFSPLTAGAGSSLPGGRQLSITLEQALAPRFTFDEFVWLQFSPQFWESWTTVSGFFSVKETTD